jgi:hypothetical protein
VLALSAFFAIWPFALSCLGLPHDFVGGSCSAFQFLQGVVWWYDAAVGSTYCIFPQHTIINKACCSLAQLSLFSPSPRVHSLGRGNGEPCEGLDAVDAELDGHLRFLSPAPNSFLVLISPGFLNQTNGQHLFCTAFSSIASNLSQNCMQGPRAFLHFFLFF